MTKSKRRTITLEEARDTAQRVGGTHCAILTRYYGATNTRGARIVARLSGGAGRPRVSIGYPYELDELEGHTLAALTLAESMRHELDPYAVRIVSAGAIEGGYAFTIETPPAY